MLESTDVQIQGERNIDPENRSKHEGFEKVTKASMWKMVYFWWGKYDKVCNCPLEAIIFLSDLMRLNCGHFCNSLF